MAGILGRLPGAGLLREAWHATQLAGALAEKKRQERALVLAEKNAQLAPFKGKKANEKLKELFDNEKYGEIAQLYVPGPVYRVGADLVDVWWRTWDIYWIFVLLRIVIVLFPQSGYIHPDEYFQTVEVITGDVLGTSVERTWEFNSTTPIRSVTTNMIIWGLPLYLLKIFDYIFNFVTGWTIIGPYLVTVVPRLVMLALSFVSDFTIYQICLLYKHSYNQCLTTLASSYVMLIYSTRTFSNSLELCFVSMLIYLAAHCLKRTSETVYLQAMIHESYVKAETPKEKAKIKKKEKLIPPHDFKFAIPISVLIAVGLFNRPTYVAFACVPLFYWFQRGVSTNSIVSPFQMFNFRMASLGPGVVLTSLIIIFSDSMYYGDLTWKKLWHLTMAWEDWKVTPFQFVMYNLVPGNLDQHGTHPCWLHTLVNIPLLYGPLGICALASAVNFVAEIVVNDWKNKPGVRSIYAMTMFIFIVGLTMLSMVPHQEPRFLIPLTVPVVLMNSHKLRWKWNGIKPILVIWYIFNIAMSVFYGLIHQGGVSPAIKYIGQDLSLRSSTQEVNVLWSHTYMPPKFGLLQISPKSLRMKRESNKTQFDFPSYFLRPDLRLNFRDLAGKSVRFHVRNEMLALATRAKLKKNVENFLVVPTHLVHDLEKHLEGEVDMKSVAYFFPHVSMESIPNLGEEVNKLLIELTDCRVLTDFSGIFHAFFNLLGHFGLSLYKFESHAAESTTVNVRSTNANKV